MRDVLARYTNGAEFRVVHFSIQDNHLHMIVEASNSDVFERKMRGLLINAARALHVACGTQGRVFHRFHSTGIKTKRYARNAIAYVLGNWRRHTKDFHNGRLLPDILDRYSSAISFDGWSRRFSIPADYKPLPVSAPRTYLLRSGWAFEGPLDPYDVPGPLRAFGYRARS